MRRGIVTSRQLGLGVAWAVTVSTSALLTAMQNYATAKAAVATAQTTQQAAADALAAAIAAASTAAAAVQTEMQAVYTAIGSKP